jgi:minichromosome maintenance protein 10
LIEKGSQHQDLVASAEQEAEDNYFNNMETKEKIEDKMLNTHKVEAKAVQCTQVNSKLLIFK